MINRKIEHQISLIKKQKQCYSKNTHSKWFCHFYFILFHLIRLHPNSAIDNQNHSN